MISHTHAQHVECTAEGVHYTLVKSTFSLSNVFKQIGISLENNDVDMARWLLRRMKESTVQFEAERCVFAGLVEVTTKLGMESWACPACGCLYEHAMSDGLEYSRNDDY